MKAIASWLNERGYMRRGHKFATGGIHDILTATTYYGQHFFNRFDSRGKKLRPPSQWIPFEVPAIIDEEPFNIVQGLLQSRRSRRVPPRVVNGPTFLAGIARCGYCNTALIQNTGKGGQYRYYCCSRKLKEGPTSCRGLRMPMDKLDGVVVGEITRHILDPERLAVMLEGFVRQSADHAERNRDQLARLRRERTEVEASRARLLQAVEKGLTDIGDPALRERMIALALQRDEIARTINDLQSRIASAAPVITPEKIGKVALLLRDRLHNGPAGFRQAYARLLVDEVSVTKEEIRIRGSKSALARAASHGADIPAPAVLSFIREWRARKDSNL